MISTYSLTETTPENIVVRTGKTADEIIVRFSPVRHSTHYVIELAPVDNPSEIIRVHTYKTRRRIKGLLPGTEYGVKVRAVIMPG